MGDHDDQTPTAMVVVQQLLTGRIIEGAKAGTLRRAQAGQEEDKQSPFGKVVEMGTGCGVDPGLVAVGENAPKVFPDDPAAARKDCVGESTQCPASQPEDRAGEGTDEATETFGNKFEGIAHGWTDKGRQDAGKSPDSTRPENWEMDRGNG